MDEDTWEDISRFYAQVASAIDTMHVRYFLILVPLKGFFKRTEKLKDWNEQRLVSIRKAGAAELLINNHMSAKDANLDAARVRFCP